MIVAIVVQCRRRLCSVLSDEHHIKQCSVITPSCYLGLTVMERDYLTIVLYSESYSFPIVMLVEECLVGIIPVKMMGSDRVMPLASCHGSEHTHRPSESLRHILQSYPSKKNCASQFFFFFSKYSLEMTSSQSRRVLVRKQCLGIVGGVRLVFTHWYPPLATRAVVLHCYHGTIS